LLLTAGAAAAQDAPAPTVESVAEQVTAVSTATSLLWVVLGAVLVIFMQAGFALVETGFCRAKHAAHVVSTNFAIFGLGFVGFFFVGFPLAFGGFSYSAFGLDTPIGGKEVSITLKNRYQLEWRQYGKFWFLEVQGRSQ
jgi:Amt family ammonium transporter